MHQNFRQNRQCPRSVHAGEVAPDGMAMADFDYTLPHPAITPTTPIERDRLTHIGTRIQAIEAAFRNVDSTLGKARNMKSTWDRMQMLDKFEAYKLSGVTGLTVAAMESRNDSLVARARDMHSTNVDVGTAIEELKAFVENGSIVLQQQHSIISEEIRRIDKYDLSSSILHDVKNKVLEEHATRINGLTEVLSVKAANIATGIHWAETVLKNGQPLNLEAARKAHDANLAMLSDLGTRQDRGVTKLNDLAGRDEALAAAQAALKSGRSLAVGEMHTDPSARQWLGESFATLKADGARFVELELPRYLQDDIDSFRAALDQGRGDAGVAEFRKALRLPGEVSGGTDGENSMIELVKAAHRTGLPVVAGDPGYRTEGLQGRREVLEPYMAGVHRDAVKTYGGPGVILVGGIHTNPLDGLEKHIPGLVSMDWKNSIIHGSVSTEPGDVVVNPWNRNHIDLAPLRGVDIPENDYARFQVNNEGSTVTVDGRKR